MAIELYPYQQRALYDAALNHQLLNFDCGLGKTVTAIEIGEAFLKQDLLASTVSSHKGRVLVTAPKRLVTQWAGVIHEQTGRGVTVIPTGILYDPNKLEGWVLTHYEVLSSKSGKLLRKVKWDVSIADECHYIRNRNAKRTDALKAIWAFRRIGLTATPLDKSPDELWSILNWFDPRRWRGYWNFVRTYCKVEELPTWFRKTPQPVQQIKGAREDMLPLLAEEIGPFFTRVTKEEAAPWLPELRIQKIPVEMSPAQQKAYLNIARADDIIVDVTEDLTMFIPNVLARITRLQQATSGALEGVKSEKVKWALEYFENNPLENMLIFTRFVSTAQTLARQLECEIVTHGTGRPEAFIAGNARVAVGTIDAMGEGIDGLQRATTAVFVDQHWSSIKMTQAISRIHRLGIREPKNIVYLYCPKTRDTLVLKSIEEKWTTQELVYSYLQGEPDDN